MLPAGIKPTIPLREFETVGQISGVETMAVGVAQVAEETGGKGWNRWAGEEQAAGVTGYWREHASRRY